MTMFAKTKEQPVTNAGWVSLDMAAEILGMTKSGFHKEVRPLLPEIAVRNAGKRGTELHAPTLIDQFIKKRTGNWNWKRDLFGQEAR